MADAQSHTPGLLCVALERQIVEPNQVALPAEQWVTPGDREWGDLLAGDNEASSLCSLALLLRTKGPLESHTTHPRLGGNQFTNIRDLKSDGDSLHRRVYNQSPEATGDPNSEFHR